MRRASGTEPLRVAIELPLRHQVELEDLLRDLYDPRSPLFRHFLSVEQFTDRFGPTQADYEEVVRFVARQGLTVSRVTPNRLVLDVAGPTERFEGAFHIEMGVYQHPVEHRTFFAPNVEPSIEAGIPILSVAGLTDRERPRPVSQQGGSLAAKSFAANGSGPGGAYLGSDMRQAYAHGLTLDGTGQAVALFELGPYDLRDIHGYFSSLGQPLMVPIVDVLLGGVDGLVPDGGDDGEVALDIEQAISLAPNLSSLIVYETYGRGNSELDVWNQIATDNVARQISSSWSYLVADANDEQVFMEFAAQGQNLFEASGDNGAYSAAMGMGFPTSDAFLVSVGGTRLTVDSDADAGVSWVSEVAWPNSGGGVSTTNVGLPNYQQGVANADNQGSTTLRNIPDVCAEAEFDNYVCSNGYCGGGWGGTSFAAPRWAGFLALVNQQANGTPIGFLNPSLYAIGQGAGYASDFHDISMGNNFNDASPALYSAVAGYDLVTGWGSPTGQNLIDALAPSPTGSNFTLMATPSLGEPPAPSATFVIESLPTGGFTDTIDLTATVVGVVPGMTTRLSAPTMSGSDSVNLTVTAAASTPESTFQVVVTGTSGNLSHAVFVTLGPRGFFLRAPRLVFVDQAAQTSLAIGVNPVNGFEDAVDVVVRGNLASGVTAGLSASQASPSDPPLQLTIAATALGTTGLYPLGLSGEADGGLTDFSPLLLAVSAAIGGGGPGIPIDLSATYNTLNIATDGVVFSQDGGLPSSGYAYSANLLAPARLLSGVQFVFGPPDQLDAVSCAAQSVPLPPAAFTTLWLFAAGIYGAQPAQEFSVGYADGTSDTFIQDLSDWDFPQDYRGEVEAVAMPYRNVGDGTRDSHLIQNLYAYSFPLDPSKVVKNLTLPQNSNVIVHAVTLMGLVTIDAGTVPVSDAGRDLPNDAGVEIPSPRGCGCTEGAGDPTVLSLGMIWLARLRRRRSR